MLGFSWAALLFGPLWLLANRLWRPLALFALGLALVGFLVARDALGEAAAAWLYGVYALYLGFEGRALLGAALERRGSPLADLVCAPDLWSAEAGFLARGFISPTPPPASAAAGAPSFPRPPQILGLFPEAGR